MLPVRTAIVLNAIQNEISKHILARNTHTIYIDETGDELDLFVDRDGIGVIEDDDGEPLLRVKFQVIMLPLDGD